VNWGARALSMIHPNLAAPSLRWRRSGPNDAAAGLGASILMQAANEEPPALD
jgi:hypothetical protein